MFETHHALPNETTVQACRKCSARALHRQFHFQANSAGAKLQDICWFFHETHACLPSQTPVQTCRECSASALHRQYKTQVQASALHRQYKRYYSLAREPMDPDVDDVVGALQERLLSMGVGRDDMIVADPFMRRASWRTHVSPALLENVSKMFIIRDGRWRSPPQSEVEEFRTIRARMRARTARRAHQVGIALTSLPWLRCRQLMDADARAAVSEHPGPRSYTAWLVRSMLVINMVTL